MPTTVANKKLWRQGASAPPAASTAAVAAQVDGACCTSTSAASRKASRDVKVRHYVRNRVHLCCTDPICIPEAGTVELQTQSSVSLDSARSFACLASCAFIHDQRKKQAYGELIRAHMGPRFRSEPQPARPRRWSGRAPGTTLSSPSQADRRKKQGSPTPESESCTWESLTSTDVCEASNLLIGASFKIGCHPTVAPTEALADAKHGGYLMQTMVWCWKCVQTQ